MTREPKPRGKGRMADIGYAWDREQWRKEIAQNKKRQARKEKKLLAAAQHRTTSHDNA